MKAPKALPAVERRGSKSANAATDANVAPSVNWGRLLSTAATALPGILEAF